MISGFEELQNLAEEEIRGYFLKPVNSLEFCRRHGVKALLVQDKASALSSAENVTFPIMLQEYIPGPATAHYFLDGFIDRNGRTCALFARRRLRMYPPKVGNSSLLVSIPVQEIQPAVASLQTILDGLHYRGIFSAEFKYDQRDGKYKILEVNARPWWYVEFAARCGVDVCTMAYRDALGMEVNPVFDYHVGRRCIHLSNNIAGFRHHADGFPGSFFSWAKSVVGAYDAIFRWSDPGPYIAFGFGQFTRHPKT
jgi:predicted ATP-grasp superfamily ATP-dependent carboligase